EAPVGETEEALARIWAELLGVERVGRNDNFFELGGHSLRAVQLADALKQWQTDLPLREFLRHPTISALASSIRRQRRGTQRSVLKQIRMAGAGKPLFLIGDETSDAVSMSKLISRLDAGFPVYSLTYALHESDPPTTPRSIARRLIQFVQNVQPHGPYRLAGWRVCGGVIAHDVATQLLGIDEAIEFLALIDAPDLSEIERYAGSDLDDESSVTRMTCSRETLFDREREPTARYSEENQNPHGDDAARKKVARVFHEAVRDYISEPMQLPISLICANSGAPSDEIYDWSSIILDERLRSAGARENERISDDVAISALGDALSRKIRAQNTAPLMTPSDAYAPNVTISLGLPSATTLYCIPGAGGNVSNFVELAGCLGDTWSVEGLQPRGLSDGDVPHATVPAAAKAYVKAILKKYSKGPIHLLGHSFGGWVAFEMALQLRATGYPVASVIVLDTEPPDHVDISLRDYTSFEARKRWLAIVEQASNGAIKDEKDDLLALPWRDYPNAIHKRLVRAGFMPKNSDAIALAGSIRTFEAALRTFYKPDIAYPYPVHLVLADNADHDASSGDGGHIKIIEGWRRWAPRLVPLRSPGNHMTMLKPPFVTSLAEQVNDIMEPAQNVVGG
ncbi:alpha/beta fold hydrolase, partial [Methylosinus sp. Sm6]|uniref:thioesterase domain-containing protein n=1 Tax=Methylosinus sp. Sm6 TaxID=2866948 RepID=UPI001C99DDB9